MSAQFPDTYRFEGKVYDIIGMTEELPFDPREYGFQPVVRCTACWRGYYCEFAVRDKKLYLDNFHVYCEPGQYPAFLGVQPEDEGLLSSKVYKGLNHLINYNGKIVIGDQFLDDYYIHMGFQRAWAFEKVLELDFENGILVDKKDHSDYVAGIRKKLEADPKLVDRLTGYREDGYVEKCFSLDCKVKAWWI